MENEEYRYNEHDYAPFFDQEYPSEPIKYMLGSEDRSQPYELDATGVFLTTQNNVLVVEVSGCSCWPDRGHTTQTLFSDNCFYGKISGQLADKVRARIMELKTVKSNV